MGSETTKEKTEICPFCQGSLDEGWLLGNQTMPNLIQYGMQWFDGKLTWESNFFQIGESIGKLELLKGSYILGVRCKNCRKIILDY